MDKLVLPFVFIPDGSPEALLPPRYGHIRLRARFIPAGSAEAAGTSPASGPDESDDAGDGWQSDPGRGADAWTDDAGAGTATSPAAHDLAPGSYAAIGRSLLALADVEQSGADFHVASRQEPSPNGRSHFIATISTDFVGTRFAGPGAPSDSADPRITAAQVLIMQAAQNVLNEVNDRKIIVPANRAAAGSVMHRLFANEIRAMNIPGAQVEQSFQNGEDAKYGADGSVRTDVLLRDSTGDVIAVWDFKTGKATEMPLSRIEQIVRAFWGLRLPPATFP
ncbi:MAG TPA: hypothetical protein VJY39_14860 [Acidisphaera sp.]|nr:hypothetical protein [Acidisphaera sp.]